MRKTRHLSVSQTPEKLNSGVGNFLGGHYWVHWSTTGDIIIFDVNGFMHSLVVVVPKTFFPFSNPFDSSRHHFLALPLRLSK